MLKSWSSTCAASCIAVLTFLALTLLGSASVSGQINSPIKGEEQGAPQSARMISSYSPRYLAGELGNGNTTAPLESKISDAALSSVPLEMEQRVFDLVNSERTAHGLTRLTWNSRVAGMARLHSNNMAASGSFGHVEPDDLDTAERARRANIAGWKALGENIAFNQNTDDAAAFAVEHWLQSPMHRSNILNPMFTESGLGVAKADDGRIYFTQVFISH